MPNTKLSGILVVFWFCRLAIIWKNVLHCSVLCASCFAACSLSLQALTQTDSLTYCEAHVAKHATYQAVVMPFMCLSTWESWKKLVQHGFLCSVTHSVCNIKCPNAKLNHHPALCLWATVDRYSNLCTLRSVDFFGAFYFASCFQISWNQLCVWLVVSCENA